MLGESAQMHADQLELELLQAKLAARLLQPVCDPGKPSSPAKHNTPQPNAPRQGMQPCLSPSHCLRMQFWPSWATVRRGCTCQHLSWSASAGCSSYTR